MARNTNGERFSLKDELFNREKVRFLGTQFAAADPGFDAAAFERHVMRKLLKLELKERIAHIADVLEGVLDADFAVAARQIEAALPPALDPTKTDDDFGDFIIAPLGEYVVRHGCNAKHLRAALKLLKELTKRFSMEDAIRFFINAFPKETFATFTKWSTDSNYHVRRLVSEGTRPLLPWSARLQIAHHEPIPYLDTLHADPTRYVTRSVANHLNDISKSDPKLVIATLKRWHKAKQQEISELDWMTKHALRTLIKQGNTEALQLLGYRSNPAVTVSDFSVKPVRLSIGEALTFSFTLTSTKSEPVLVDYVVDFVKKNGTTAPKVFKLKQLTLAPGESVTLTKRHPFKVNSSTFTYYSGTHALTLQINGTTFDSIRFNLVV